MKTKKLYICPAMRAHKLKMQACMAAESTQPEIIEDKNNDPEEIESGAKSSRFSSYDGFGNKSEESSSDAWK